MRQFLSKKEEKNYLAVGHHIGYRKFEGQGVTKYQRCIIGGEGATNGIESLEGKVLVTTHVFDTIEELKRFLDKQKSGITVKANIMASLAK